MKNLWSVEFLNDSVERVYKALIGSGKLSLEDNRVIKKRVIQIEEEGPCSLRLLSFLE